MIIYEVNLKVNRDIKVDYEDWLRPHIKEVSRESSMCLQLFQILLLDGFLSAEFWSRNPEDEGLPKDDENQYWTVQYRVENRATLQHYFDHNAAKMRQEGIDRFGGKFSASRRILELQDTFDKHSAHAEPTRFNQ